MEITLTPDQHHALEKLKSFILDTDKQVFIMKGAAGSGKTTLIRTFVGYLKENKKLYSVMAPTGRAAKILRDKIGEGCTIHKGIYNFDKLESKEIESEDPSKKSFHYYFPLQIMLEAGRYSTSENAHIIIVDEASMISDVETKHELFTFGTGKLLSDLITFANLSNHSSKLVFVGDNAQLPPVTDSFLNALSETYFQEKELKVETAELQTVHRQLEESGILQNANEIRELLKQPRQCRNTFRINANNKDVKEIDAEQIALDYVNRFPNPEVGNGVILAFSNAQTKNYNQAVRSKIFPENPDIVAGDVILINNNNYHSYAIEIFNGDMAKALHVEQTTETKTIPVFIDNKRQNINLKFRNITFRLPHFGSEISCKIIDSLLNSPHRDLSISEMKALYIDFCIRFNNEQKQRRENGLPFFKEGSAEFKNMLKNDPYFNALRIKYGYSITCHKAQGGEWDTVYVDYSGKVGLHDDALRWCYTATTRAKKELLITNIPNINRLEKLKFSTITQVGKADIRYYQSSDLYPTPYHSANTNLGKRLKYHEIVEKINNTPYSLKNVCSYTYMEKYFFEMEGKEILIDLYHDGAGIFSELNLTQDNTTESQLKVLINEVVEQEITITYHPTNQMFQNLFQKISAICSESDIQITNVIEEPNKYFVLYCFKTTGKFSMIQFYYNQKNGFTTALPKSDRGIYDEKLQTLIRNLE